MPKGGLGLGLGLNKRQQRGFQQAAQQGITQAGEWIGGHQKVANRAANFQAGTERGDRLQSFIQGGGKTPWKAGGAGAQPPPAAPGVTTPTPPAVPPPPGTQPSLQDIAKKYQIDMPPELVEAGQGAIKTWKDAQDWQNSAYEEQFNRLQQQSKQAGDINAAKLNETYGSMGARYGSDIQQAQADMQRKQTLDLQTAGFDVRQGLNQQRLAQMSGAMGAMQGVGASKANIMTGGMEKAWQDYMMQMAPPAMWDEMMGYATSFNPPGQVVY